MACIQARTGIALAAGQQDKARVFHSAALALTRRTGDKQEQARALVGLGEICRQQSHHDRAARYYQDAMVLYRDIGDPGGEAEALNGSGEILLATGQPDRAVTCHRTALDLASQTGDRYQQARAHYGLASASGAARQHDHDRYHSDQHWQHALNIYTDLGVPEAGQLRTMAAALGWR